MDTPDLILEMAAHSYTSFYDGRVKYPPYMGVFAEATIHPILQKLGIRFPTNLEEAHDECAPCVHETKETESFSILLWVLIRVCLRTANGCLTTKLQKLYPLDKTTLVSINDKMMNVSPNVGYFLRVLVLLGSVTKPWDVPPRHIPNKSFFKSMQMSFIEAARQARQAMPSVSELRITSQYGNGNFLPSDIRWEIYNAMDVFIRYMVSFIDDVQELSAPSGTLKCMRCREVSEDVEQIEVTIDVDVHEDPAKKVFVRKFMFCPNKDAHFYNLVRISENNKRKLDNPAPAKRRNKRRKGLTLRKRVKICEQLHKSMMCLARKYGVEADFL